MPAAFPVRGYGVAQPFTECQMTRSSKSAGASSGSLKSIRRNLILFGDIRRRVRLSRKHGKHRLRSQIELVLRRPAEQMLNRPVERRIHHLPRHPRPNHQANRSMPVDVVQAAPRVVFGNEDYGVLPVLAF